MVTTQIFKDLDSATISLVYFHKNLKSLIKRNYTRQPTLFTFMWFKVNKKTEKKKKKERNMRLNSKKENVINCKLSHQKLTVWLNFLVKAQNSDVKSIVYVIRPSYCKKGINVWGST